MHIFNIYLTHLLGDLLGSSEVVNDVSVDIAVVSSDFVVVVVVAAIPDDSVRVSFDAAVVVSSLLLFLSAGGL